MYDIAIVGGGIHGCGIARDAAGRGLSVLLAEKDDLASGTSSASTKLIHGGLRYLERFDFRLVRESLTERETLLAMAPHIVRPMRFVLPHRRGLRPALLIRLGLLLYDRLGWHRSLPASAAVDLARSPAGKPLKPGFTLAFEYSDCVVDDARLVVLNAVSAAALGADIRVRTEVVSAARDKDRWRIDLRNAGTGRYESVEARALINAAGAWVGDIVSNRIQTHSVPRLRLVRGSHIVVRKPMAPDRAYIFQSADRRVVFAIPYEGDYTLIGTTDVDVAADADLSTVAASEAEVEYLCAAVNEYLADPVAPSDIVWSYSGIRALQDDGRAAAQDATRDFALLRDGAPGEPPLLSIVGGKITTYRHVAEMAVDRLAPALPPSGPPWTSRSTLPGGDLPDGGPMALARKLLAAFPLLGASTAERVARSYGTIAWDIFGEVREPQDLGLHFGSGLYEREVAYLVEKERAMTADDLLWRRSKLGLRLVEAERRRLEDRLLARAGATDGSSRTMGS